MPKTESRNFVGNKNDISKMLHTPLSTRLSRPSEYQVEQTKENEDLEASVHPMVGSNNNRSHLQARIHSSVH